MRRKPSSLKEAARALGRRGGRVTRERAGSDHYAKIGRDGSEKRWAERRRAREALDWRPGPDIATLADLVRHARKVLGEEGVRLTANDEARVIALSLAPRFSDRKPEEIIGIIKQGWDKP